MWLDACIGSWQNDTGPVKAFLDSGGNRSRRLLDGEAVSLNQRFPGGFSPGLDLVNIALQNNSQDVLRLFLPPEALAPASAPPPLSTSHMRQLWLQACRACMDSEPAPVLRFLQAGGSPTRRLLASEAGELCRTLPQCFLEGETLANLALKWDNQVVLACVLDSADRQERRGEERTAGGEEREGGSEGEGGEVAARAETRDHAEILWGGGGKWKG